jgi:hypothetical protein
MCRYVRDMLGGRSEFVPARKAPSTATLLRTQPIGTVEIESAKSLRFCVGRAEDGLMSKSLDC